MNTLQNGLAVKYLISNLKNRDVVSCGVRERGCHSTQTDDQKCIAGKGRKSLGDVKRLVVLFGELKRAILCSLLKW